MASLGQGLQISRRKGGSAAAPSVTVAVIGTCAQRWSADNAFVPATQSRAVSGSKVLIATGAGWNDNGFNPLPLPTDNNGTFVAAVNNSVSDGGSPTYAQIAYVANPSAATHVCTPPVLGVNGDGSWTLIEATGLATTAVLRTTGSFRHYHAPATPPDPATVQTCTITTAAATTQVGDLMIAVLQIDPNSTSNANAQIGLPAGWTLIAQNQNMTDNVGYMACYKVATSGGSQSITFNWVDNATFVVDGALAVFKKA